MYSGRSGERNCTKLRNLPVDGESLHTDHRDVEKMTITINSVVGRDGRYRARARSVVQDARIMIEVRFQADEGASKANLWLEARDQCLRYLDVA